MKRTYYTDWAIFSVATMVILAGGLAILLLVFGFLFRVFGGFAIPLILFVMGSVLIGRIAVDEVHRHDD